MHRFFTLLVLFFFTSLTQAAEEPYKLGKDSLRHEGVPRGEVSERVWKSEIFPGTIRRYWVYVPAENDPAVAAPVMVFQVDGEAGLSSTRCGLKAERDLLAAIASLALRTYIGNMSAIITRAVNDLAEPDRRSLENLLGCALGAEQQVFVMAFEPNLQSNENARHAAIHRIRNRLAEIDRYQAAKGIVGDEIDTAIDEAMQHVRPRSS